jgi:predicted GNAT family N-acyltransferase
VFLNQQGSEYYNIHIPINSTKPTPTPERFQDIPHIKGILIEEEQRNNGFGKLLLDTLCKEEDIDSVVVDAQMELTEFYAKTYPHIVYIKRRS